MNRTVTFGEMTNRQRDTVLSLESAGWVIDTVNIRFVQMANDDLMEMVRVDLNGNANPVSIDALTV